MSFTSPTTKRIGPKIANPQQITGAPERIEPNPRTDITIPATISVVPSPLAIAGPPRP